MAQVSYGTITITDTNDIEEIFSLYGGSNDANTSPTYSYAAITDGTTWKRNVTAITNYKYIWQITAITKTGITVDSSNWQQFYGAPIRITGEEGDDARNIIAVTPYYYLSSSNSSQTGGNWSTSPQAYPSTGVYYYWTKTITTYDSGSPSESTPVLDMFLTNAAKDARDANVTAALANSIAQHANEDAQGAMSQAASNVNEVKRIWYAQAAATPVPAAPTTGITTSTTHDAWSITKPAANESYQYYFYCDQTKTGGGVYSWSEVILDTSTLSQYQIGAMSAKVRNYWWDSAGAHIAGGTSTSGEISATSPTSSYGYNTLTGLTGISFKYNDAKVVDLNSTTPSLDFYQPPTISGSTVTQGKKTMMLSANALSFYDPTNGTTEQAKLDTNGLVLKKGGVKAGTAGQSGFIYLSTENYGSNLTINSHQASNWREVIGTKFGVDADGNLYASNANISGTIAIGSGSTIDSGATVGGTSLSNIAQNASTGAQAASDLSDFETTVSNTYATQEALSDVEEQIPDVSGLASKTDTVKSVTTETQYRLSNSSTSLTGSGTGYTWSTTIPTWSSNKYLWTRIATTYTPISGTATTVYKPGTSTNEYGIYDSQLTTALSTASSAQTTANGAAASITTTQQYNLSSSTSSANGTWQDTVPTWSANNYIWVRLKIVKTSMSGAASTSYTPSESGTYDKALTTALSTAASAKTTAENAAPKSSAVAKTQQIYYRSNSSTKPTVYPTAWVTAETNKWNNGNVSETDFNGWRRKVTPISDGTGAGANVTKYLYLWTATQKQLVDGTVVTLTANDIALDDSTTVIDGGKIITGSVTANQLNAADINASNSLTIGALTTTTQNDILNSELADDIANAEANASYSVEIKVTAINYVANTATLVAIPYYQGSTTIPSGVTLTYTWYKDSISSSNIVGSNSNTLSVTNTSAMGLEHNYICVISKP